MFSFKCSYKTAASNNSHIYCLGERKQMSGSGDSTLPFFRPTLNFFSFKYEKILFDFYSIFKTISKNVFKAFIYAF